jgi:hypothetical protein
LVSIARAAACHSGDISYKDVAKKEKREGTFTGMQRESFRDNSTNESDSYNNDNKKKYETFGVTTAPSSL